MGNSALVVLERASRVELQKEVPPLVIDEQSRLADLEAHQINAATEATMSDRTIEITTTQMMIRTVFWFCMVEYRSCETNTVEDETSF